VDVLRFRLHQQIPDLRAGRDEIERPGCPSANPLKKNSYTRLQQLTPAQQAIFTRYDKLQAVPFTDFGNRSALTGSSFDPTVLEHETWSQIAAELRNPHGVRGRSILGTANYIAAAICQLTGDQPATACTPAVRSLLPGG
jgi:hypothetical protein